MMEGCTNQIQDAEAQMQCSVYTDGIMNDNINTTVFDVNNNNSRIYHFFQVQGKRLTWGQVQR